jgi:hypothetical protein
MAIDPAEILRPITRDEPPPAPLAGTRSQSVQRLQIGLFGLAAMVLLVSLANIILKNAAQNEARVVPEAVSTVPADNGAPGASDPLADAGVVPAVPEAEEQGRSGDAAPAIQP